MLFAFALGVHFVVNDHGLREHHKDSYDRVGRWVLAAAVVVLFAFLAEGVVLNVLKEELPEERESRFWAFALGATLYAAILLITF